MGPKGSTSTMKRSDRQTRDPRAEYGRSRWRREQDEVYCESEGGQQSFRQQSFRHQWGGGSHPHELIGVDEPYGDGPSEVPTDDDDKWCSGLGARSDSSDIPPTVD